MGHQSLTIADGRSFCPNYNSAPLRAHIKMVRPANSLKIFLNGSFGFTSTITIFQQQQAVCVFFLRSFVHQQAFSMGPVSGKHLPVCLTNLFISVNLCTSWPLKLASAPHDLHIWPLHLMTFTSDLCMHLITLTSDLCTSWPSHLTYVAHDPAKGR